MSDPVDGGGTVEHLPDALRTCRRCPRLVAHREAVARDKRASYRHETYWGAPVPGFGDRGARLAILGLAPGAHGSNRTGRQFTGDASGAFLFPALHRAGLADRPDSEGRHDGLQLRRTWITAAVRCVPPGNKPTRAEAAACRPWLEDDLAHLPDLRVVLAFGAFAHAAYLDRLAARGAPVVKARHPFAHGAVHDLPAAYPGGAAHVLVDGYHPSFQNTNTGRLTPAMMDAVLARAKALASVA
ncbi:MAG: uracil-DNA glycosylase [Trueperaceae bacterium]|nr:uracil-DNA glycosylase [Trueperaceae bacterium]